MSAESERRPSNNPAGRPAQLAGARRVQLYVDEETDRIVARRYGEIEDEAQILALEAEAVAAHVAAGAEVSEDLLQYVSVYGG